MKCVIVDDVSIDSKYLKELCGQAKLSVTGTFDDAVAALDFIKSNEVDIVFLDIDMPGITGLELATLIPEQVLVVFVSSHKEYAVNAFDISAFDFLSKPVKLSRLITSVQRAEEHLSNKNTGGGKANQEGFILKLDGVYKRFQYDDILYLESMSNFMKIHTRDKVWVSYGTASFFEENLPALIFMRVHRQYIVNLRNMESFTSTELTINGKSIPVGAAYKEVFLQRALDKSYLKTR